MYIYSFSDAALLKAITEYWLSVDIIVCICLSCFKTGQKVINFLSRSQKIISHRDSGNNECLKN